MYTEIRRCRICANTDLIPILDLGRQALTGVFPARKSDPVASGPLELVKCNESAPGACGLVQLRHSYDTSQLYGDGYGYRSGLNRAMVEHLRGRVRHVTECVPLREGDLVIDIGSNDSTLLQFYPSNRGLTLLGVDPSGEKLRPWYPPHIQLVADFFSADAVRRVTSKKAKIVTSLSMFYDLEDPLGFVEQVHEVLDDDGLWVLEQSYLPAMLAYNAFDTVCHEHLEYYALKQIKWMADKVGYDIIDVEFNGVNGGSFAVALAKKGSSHQPAPALVDKILGEEHDLGLSTLSPYNAFSDRVFRLKDDLLRLLERIRLNGGLVVGYGASTKGNVLLQLCGLTESEIPCIGEINSDKYGRFTPGTAIPIVSEEAAKALSPDYLLILPWHFRDYFIEREAQFIAAGGKLIYPMPNVESLPAAGSRMQKAAVQPTTISFSI